MINKIFEIIGIISTSIALLWFGGILVRKIFPRKYTWNSCPTDHDTMYRYGHKGPCPTCGLGGNDDHEE